MRSLLAIAIVLAAAGVAHGNTAYNVTDSTHDLIIGSNATVDNNLTVDATLAVTTSITIGGNTVPYETASTSNTLPLWTSSGVLGNSSETDNGTSFGAGANFTVTLSSGHFVGASGGYVTGDLGLSNSAAAFTPGTVLDIRVANTTPLEIFNYKSSQSGTGILLGKGRGSIASPTSVLITDQLLSLAIYGYDSNNTIDNNAEISTNVDNTVGAGIVPSNFRIKLQDAAGTNRERVRVDSAGHWIAPVIASPTITGCGTSPTVSGGDVSGSVVAGSADSTGCTITFAQSYAATSPSSTANCTVTAQTAFTWTYSVSNTAITIVSTNASGATFNWTCIGY